MDDVPSEKSDCPRRNLHSEEFLRALNYLYRRHALKLWGVLVAILLGGGELRAQSTVNIHSIQSNLPNSPYMGRNVTTEGIVVAILSDGFYIENSPWHVTCTDPAILNCWDDFVSTSEGIFVYTGSAPDPSYAVIGYLLYVTGTVTVSNQSAEPAARGTEIKSASTPVRADNVNYTVPPPVAVDVLNSAPTGKFGQWLEFEGMRINIAVLQSTSGTSGTVATPSGVATSSGQFYGILGSATALEARPFRSSGISMLEAVPASAPPTVARWSGNPDLLFIDSSSRGGPQAPLDVMAGTTIANVTGVVDYHESPLGYTSLVVDNGLYGYIGYGAVTPPSTAKGTPAAIASAAQVTIATQNLDSFYDDSTIDESAFSSRVTKMATGIVDFENSPDIIGVQEVQSLDALNALVARIAGDGGPTYTPCWFQGNDSSGLANGFLINTAKVHLVSCAQVDLAKSFQAMDGTTKPLFARPPLVATIGIPRGAADDQVVILNGELLDRANIDDPAQGPDVRAQRAAQAEELSAIAQTYQSAGSQVIALGGFDSFEFNDGFVDTLGSIDGSPTAAQLVTLSSSSTTTPPLVNLTILASNANDERYSFVENGSAEETDHILVSTALAPNATVSYARFGADFPLVDVNDSTNALRASSHDGVIAYLNIPYIPKMTLASSLNPSVIGQNVTFTATLSGIAGVPTGTVTISDGNTVLCQAVTLNQGAGTCSTSSLAVGSHTINATYSGSSTYQAATAQLIQVVTLVPPPDYSLTIFPANRTIYTGQSASYTISVAPGARFAGNVTLTCASAMNAGTCTITPATIGAGSVAQLVVQTSAPQKMSTSSLVSTGRTLYLAGGLLFILLPWRLKWRGWKTMLILAVMATLIVGIGACGSSGTLTAGTIPGSYTVTVSGTLPSDSGPVTKTTAATVNVQSLF